MLNICGFILIAGGCTLWGFRAADELSVRVRLLEELALAVQVLERELSLFRPGLPVLLERMTQGRSKQVAILLKTCREEIEQGADFTESWENQHRQLPLSERERALLSSLGQVLGQYDEAGQVQAARRIRQELDACAALRREENRVKGRLYRMLGATVGGFILLTLM